MSCDSFTCLRVALPLTRRSVCTTTTSPPDALVPAPSTTSACASNCDGARATSSRGDAELARRLRAGALRPRSKVHAVTPPFSSKIQPARSTSPRASTMSCCSAWSSAALRTKASRRGSTNKVSSASGSGLSQDRAKSSPRAFRVAYVARRRQSARSDVAMGTSSRKGAASKVARQYFLTERTKRKCGLSRISLEIKLRNRALGRTISPCGFGTRSQIAKASEGAPRRQTICTRKAPSRLNADGL
mmetsp:Transcript_27762/g.93298  ORF Transcript_27762/g.93298 Transcript_27762/m.93298 type:complete len:245 (-) Transcript_27762:863-1597(-)